MPLQRLTAYSFKCLFKQAQNDEGMKMALESYISFVLTSISDQGVFLKHVMAYARGWENIKSFFYAPFALKIRPHPRES